MNPLLLHLCHHHQRQRCSSPGEGYAFNLILVKTYIESVPDSLEESAEIDGAGYLVVFSRIILPLCTPILATIAVFTAVGHWTVA
ncbi:MAG: ABC transporter permease subunit [Treponema sp.]|nr:ABC transporter permease subunit [Treponema sp.]